MTRGRSIAAALELETQEGGLRQDLQLGDEAAAKARRGVVAQLKEDLEATDRRFDGCRAALRVAMGVFERLSAAEGLAEELTWNRLDGLWRQVVEARDAFDRQSMTVALREQEVRERESSKPDAHLPREVRDGFKEELTRLKAERDREKAELRELQAPLRERQGEYERALRRLDALQREVR